MTYALYQHTTMNPPNEIKTDVSKLFNNHPALLLGDLNVKNMGLQKSNPNGHKLFEFTSDHRGLTSILSYLLQ